MSKCGDLVVYLSDVAKEAGVSVATVSRAMNGHPAISDATKLRVQEAAKKLGYHSRKHQNKPKYPVDVVGIIIPDILTHYYTHLICALTEQFRKKNYSVVTMCSDYKQSEAAHAVNLLTGMGVRCLLIFQGDSEAASKQLVTAVHTSGIPAMFITPNYISTMDYDCLYLDERRGNTMALEHLRHRGYHKLAYIGDVNTVNSRDVFLKTMKTFKMDINPDFVRIGPDRLERGGYLRMKEILEMPELPDAVYCSYDQMAVGAISAIQEAGLRVPADIAIVSLDGIAVTEYINGGITTISAPYDDMAAIAVRILLNRVEMPYSQPQQIAIKPTLKVRGST